MFTSHRGLYRYPRMLFGLEKAPSTSQRAMDVIVSTVNGLLDPVLRCCFYFCRVPLKTSGPPTDCTGITFDHKRVIETQVLLFLQKQFQLLVSLHTDWQTWYIDVSVQHHLGTTTAYKRNWTQVVSWNLWRISAVLPSFARIAKPWPASCIRTLPCPLVGRRRPRLRRSIHYNIYCTLHWYMHFQGRADGADLTPTVWQASQVRFTAGAGWRTS